MLFFTAPDFTFTTWHVCNWALFPLGSASSFLLKLFLHSSLVAYWVPSDLVNSSFSVISFVFFLFTLFMGFSRWEYWNSLPFPSPVDHILLKLFTMTCPFCVALYGMAHSFTELDQAMIHVISLVTFLCLWFSFWRIRGLWKLPDGGYWLWGKLSLALMDRAMLSKSLTQFSADVCGCVPSLSLAWGQAMAGVMGTSFKGLMPSCCESQDCCIQYPWPHTRPLSTHASSRDFWTLTGKSGSVSYGATAPFSWVMVHTSFVPSKSLFPQSCGSAVIKFHWPSKSNSVGFSVPLPDP